ncbi:MAG: tetratricopeptide repeat protein [Candidatus Delongbacteria bacterium]|nr:tetratricopeptide repeat protein [Candidatus Delongbacteria bacterium]
MKSSIFCFLVWMLIGIIPVQAQESADSVKPDVPTIQPSNLLDTLFLDTTTIEGKVKKKTPSKRPTPKTRRTIPEPAEEQPDTLAPAKPLPSSSIRIRREIYLTATSAFENQDMEKSVQYYPLYFKLADPDSVKDEDYQRYLIAQSQLGLPQDAEGQGYLQTDILPMLETQMDKYPDNHDLQFADAQINMLINKNKGLHARKKYMKNAYHTLTAILDREPENKAAAIQLSHWHQEMGVYPKFWMKLFGFKTKGYPDAVSVMEKAKKAHPNDCEVSLEMAIAYINNKNIPAAIMEFKTLNLLPETGPQDHIYKTRALPYVINLVY